MVHCKEVILSAPEPIRDAAPDARLAARLPRWRKVPLYRAALQSGDFFRLPIIGKNELRHNFPANFLLPGQNLDTLLQYKEVEIEHSSGTSADRTAVLFRRGWWDEQEARLLRLNAFVAGVLDEYPEARRVTIVPPVCNGLVCFSNWNSLAARTMGRTLYVNQARIPFLLSEDELARMALETAGWAPQFLDVDPVQGAWFALYCERRGLRFPSVKFIVCSYEFVSVVHRRILERVFGVPVFNLYGSTETGHLFMENERGEMRDCPAAVYYEVTEEDARGIGELVVTTLTNEIMPLLRYRLGDLVERVGGPDGTDYRVHGRGRDVLLGRAGRRVTTWDVDQCFAGIGGLAHYQMRQSAHAEFIGQFIPDGAGPSPAELARVRERLAECLPPAADLRLEPVELLPPTPSGKFRLTYRG